MYNSTYRVTVAGREGAVIVRITPEAECQFTSERALMHNEYVSVPYLTVLAPLLLARPLARRLGGRKDGVSRKRRHLLQRS